MAKYLPVTISSAIGPGNLLTVFPQDLGPQGTGKEETGESAAAGTAGPAAAPPSSLLKLERVKQAGGGAVGWRRTWTAWRAVGSTVPVKGNSTMTTRYKVPNFSMLDCHKHGGCLWDVIRPGCPKHTKHQKVSPPPKPGTGAAGVVVFQAGCTDSMHKCWQLWHLLLSTGGWDVSRRLPSRCGSLPICRPLWLYHTPKAELSPSQDFSSQPRAGARH